MRTFSFLIHFLLLITTPSSLLFSQSHIPNPSFHVETVHTKKLHKNIRKKDRYHLVTYDEILNLLNEIESGKAEKKYRPKDLERINHFLAYLAQEGILPSSENTLALEEDIENLLCHDYQYAYSLDGDYAIIPTL